MCVILSTPGEETQFCRNFFAQFFFRRKFDFFDNHFKEKEKGRVRVLLKSFFT